MTTFKLNALVAAVIATLAVPTYAAQSVTVTNTPSQPVPVTVTNPSSGSANVIVTNPATNAVITRDAYPRTPVNLTLSSGVEYSVPNDQHFVIETVSALVLCGSGSAELSGDAVAAVAVFDLPEPQPVSQIRLPLVRSTASTFVALQNVRVTAMAGNIVNGFGSGTCTIGPSSFIMWVAGYLVSVDSPSLAP